MQSIMSNNYRNSSNNIFSDSDLDFYEYFGITLQEMIVQIEDHILLNIMNFVTSLPLDKLILVDKDSNTTQPKKFVSIIN